MNDDLTVLGGRIREIRKQKGLTLQQLADRTGLTAGLLSKIENLRTSPSLQVLSDLAGALGTDIAALFLDAAGSRGNRKWRHFPAEKFQLIDREENQGFAYQLIFESRLSGDRQQVMLVEVEPGARRKPVSGDGNEILYMISGHLKYRIGEDVIDFKTGDVLFFDSAVPHVPENPGREKAVLLAIYHLTEPLF